MGAGRQRKESLCPVELGEEAKADCHGGDGAGFGMKKNVGTVYTSGVIGKSELFTWQICRKQKEEQWNTLEIIPRESGPGNTGQKLRSDTRDSSFVN